MITLYYTSYFYNIDCLLPFNISQLEESIDILTVSTEQERESFAQKLSEVELSLLLVLVDD
jgi:hypothetical protein